MIFHTVTVMSFELPDEYDWAVNIERDLKDKDVIVQITDTSNLRQLKIIGNTYNMKLPMMSKEVLRTKECDEDKQNV